MNTQTIPTYDDLSQLYAGRVTPYVKGFEDATYLRVYKNGYSLRVDRKNYDAGIIAGNQALRAVR